MIDFILILFTIAVFAVGFYCGKTFQTYGEMWNRGKAWVRSQVKQI